MIQVSAIAVLYVCCRELLEVMVDADDGAVGGRQLWT